MRMRHVWFVGVVLLTIATSAAAQTALRVTHAFPARDGEMQREIAEKFMAENPGITIKLESTATNCEELLLQLLRAAITNDLPDVSAPCYQEVGILAHKNLPVPLDQFMSADQTWRDLGLEPAALSTTQWRNKTQALPVSVSTSIVYYNMDLLRRSGYERSELPKTWPEIIALAKQIRSLSKDAAGIFFEYYPDNFNWSFNGLVYSHGGRMFTSDGVIAFDSPAGRASLDLLRQFGEAGMVDMTSEQARQAFAAGTIGIYVGSNSRLSQLVPAAGTIEVRTGAFPQSASDGKLQSGGAAIAMFTRDPQKQQAAWKYLKFVVGPAAQTIMVKRTGLSPVNTKAVYSSEFLGGFYRDRPNYMTAIEQLGRIKSMDEYPGDNARKISTIIRDHLQTVVTLKRSPDDVMPDMVRDVKRLLPGQ